MKKKILGLVTMILLISTLLGGCSLDIKSVYDTLRPPKLSGENREVQMAFEKYVGKDVLLKPALSGDYRSAFVRYNIDGDGDGTEEVLVFYAESSNKSIARLEVMKKEDRQWVHVDNLLGSGSEVYSVDFADMDGDRFSEIIVGWSLYDKASEKILTAFSFNEKLKQYDPICTENFTYMLPVDLDNDSKDELFYVSVEETNKTRQATAKLLKFNGTSVDEIGRVRLDAGVSGYSAVNVEYPSESSPARIYLDAVKGENQMITDVVYYDATNKTMVAPLLDKESHSNLQTWRSINLLSADINSDGIIEIPTQSVFKGAAEVKDQTKQSSSNLYRTDWCQLVGNKLQTVIYSYTDVENGYIFSIPERLLKTVTVEKNVDNGSITFYAYSRSSNTRGDALLTIKPVYESVWKTEQAESKYTAVMPVNDKILVYEITEAGKALEITPEELSKNLMKLNYDNNERGNK